MRSGASSPARRIIDDDARLRRAIDGYRDILAAVDETDGDDISF